ncbi:putative serine/threonine-protein kinase STE20-like [Drosophila grimshawi]|uniref:GH14981 n=1 Tax=Drosophila grimshawi TaxID=7222 RepID=B4J111_DROGR|nr:putative serine/threonine-protein kinase STE20-like [Drosophila grimshawi]EDV96866.1 GH14981 [Drosophila grimshawi]
MCSNSLADYQFTKVLKHGRFSSVYKANCVGNNHSIVIKKFPLEHGNDAELKKLFAEIQCCRQFKHPNINKILHCFTAECDMFVLYPYMCFGACQILLESIFTNGFPEALIALLFKDVLSALMYIHMNDFVHGAVKAGHILLDNQKAVLTNFHESRSFIKHGVKIPVLHGVSQEKNLNWAAPEVLDQNINGYTEKCDIYSVGITACEMANGIQPYFETQPTLMYTEKIRGNVPSLLDRSTYTMLLDDQGKMPFENSMTRRTYEIFSQRILSDDFHQFVEICLNRNAENRWSAKKLMTHAFFKQCRHSTISDHIKKCRSELDNNSIIDDESMGQLDDRDVNECREDVQWNF